MPRVSIITPTKDRQAFLPALWECVRNQSLNNIEWLIHDGSPQPAPMFAGIKDPRVKYMHEPKVMTIGAKRNELCRAAKGEIIVHFDDDDFYAPHYIQDMVSFMTEQNANFVKLFGFFLYFRPLSTLAYWDLETDFPLYLCFDPRTPDAASVVRRPPVGVTDPWGYGFSFLFHRTVWEAVHFPDRDHGEDQEFADAVVANVNFKSTGKQDFVRSCIHIIHTGNSSTAFAQRIFPTKSLSEMFPDFHG
jgi:glycosyltransferase involved in cell wall biosynthesis